MAKIGTIGAGNIGGTLAKRFAELGHDVTISNSRGPQSLTERAAELGVKTGTIEEATTGADVVVLAIPLKAVADLPSDIFDGLIVIDANNYYPQRDGVIPEIGPASSTRWTADQFPKATFVKAFNNIQSAHLGGSGQPAGTPGRIALPVATDDATARELVFGLVDALGFDPVDGGSLDESWRQEPGTAIYGTDLDAAGAEKALANQQR
jgi:hypothetical protein